MRRRDLLIGATLIGGVALLRQAALTMGPDFTFSPLPHLPGFRSVTGGAASSPGPALVGLDRPSPRQMRHRATVRANPCRALFGTVPAGSVPIALFTDYNCAYCPEVSRLVDRIDGEGTGLHVVWHDLPILGPRSVAAARAAAAAGRQGAYMPAHRVLMDGILPPGPAALRRLATDLGIDADRFLAEIDGSDVSETLERTDATATVVGIAGTPALMIGRTLWVGSIDADRLTRLIAIERKAMAASGPICAAA